MRLGRPAPPEDLVNVATSPLFRRDPSLEHWIRETFIDEGASLENPDHQHLRFASIGCLWSSEAPRSRGRTIVATAEVPQFKGPGFKKAREEAFLVELLGNVPDFVLTFSAGFAAMADDASWCAPVEHELLHCGQAADEFGSPRFRRDGRPVFALKGHDVEEFVRVVERYGAGASGKATEQLVRAGSERPTVARAQVAGACGICIARAA